MKDDREEDRETQGQAGLGEQPEIGAEFKDIRLVPKPHTKDTSRASSKHQVHRSPSVQVKAGAHPRVSAQQNPSSTLKSPVKASTSKSVAQDSSPPSIHAVLGQKPIPVCPPAAHACDGQRLLCTEAPQAQLFKAKDSEQPQTTQPERTPAQQKLLPYPVWPPPTSDCPPLHVLAPNSDHAGELRWMCSVFKQLVLWLGPPKEDGDRIKATVYNEWGAAELEEFKGKHEMLIEFCEENNAGIVRGIMFKSFGV